MFFRFGVVAVAVIAIALAGVAIERGNLSLRRALSLQEYRRQLLRDEQVQLRVRVESLSSPQRLIDALPQSSSHDREGAHR